MAKSPLQKEIEEQNRALEKQRKESDRRETARTIVSQQPRVGDMIIMDEDTEEMLSAILAQYDGNNRNYVLFDASPLPRPLHDSIALQFEKLKQYGMLSFVNAFPGGAMITLSEAAKSYERRKHDALDASRKEKERQAKLETDFRNIMGMNLEQLREIYLQALQANDTLSQSLETERKQLEVIRSLFVSNEDGVAVQKDILRQLKEQEDKGHAVRDFLADKAGDLGVEAITCVAPLVIQAISVQLASAGIVL